MLSFEKKKGSARHWLIFPTSSNTNISSSFDNLKTVNCNNIYLPLITEKQLNKIILTFIKLYIEI